MFSALYLQQEFGTLWLSMGCRAVERRPQEVVPVLDVRPRGDEDGHHATVTVDARQVQGSVGFEVLIVHGVAIAVQNLRTNPVGRIEVQLKSHSHMHL